jgi:hypothetical protein
MNEIIELLESLMRQAAEMADDLTEEEMTEVLRVFQQAIEIIQHQGQGAQAPIPGPIPEIPSGPHESSNVNGFKYNPDTGELLVQFHGPYPQAAGSVYSYQGVPKYIYDVFAKGGVGPKTSGQNRYHRWIKDVTPSLGGTLNALVKAGGFAYTRLS